MVVSDYRMPVLDYSDLSRTSEFMPPTDDALINNGLIPPVRHDADIIDPIDETPPGKLERLGAVVKSGVEDIRNDEHKITAASWAATMALTQFIDRSRLVLVFGPQFATEVYENTGNSYLASLAITGLFGISNLAVGEALTQSLDRFPRAKATFVESFPKTVRLFNNLLAGMASKEPHDIDSLTTDNIPEVSDVNVGIIPAVSDANVGIAEESLSFAKALKTITLRRKQATTGIGIGSTAFVATASVNGNNKKEVRKVNVEVTGSTMVLIYGLGVGVFEGLEKMVRMGWYKQAEWVNDRVTDGKTWLGVAALTMISEYLSNRSEMKKIDAQQLN